MNLLTDDVFQVIIPEGTIRLSLPALLAALGDDRVEALTGLQRHQSDIFHIFLCYLAGSVMNQSIESNCEKDVAFWRDGLRKLAGREDDLAWELVVDNPIKPAFMQPPAPSMEVFEKDYKLKAETPDAMDVLQTAKNHDVKMARAASADSEAWALALISLQTASGVLGRGNYGIARMNSGLGSRICVGWQENRRAGSRFQRDIELLLNHRRKLLEPPYSYMDHGLRCLWLEPWDGTTGFSLAALDPFFIEVARRVRLVKRNGSIVAFGATSSSARISARDLKGNVGDPWIPIKEENSSALTLSANGFTPSLLRDLLFQNNYQPAPMQITSSEGGSGWFCTSVLVRGQGTTDGFHEAAIRIPARARPVLFGGGGERNRLAELSQRGLDMAGDIQNKVLRPALYILMEGGPDSVDFNKREVSSWVSSRARLYGAAWKTFYFDWLWTVLDEKEDVAALRPWFEKLKSLSKDTLEKAITCAPSRTGRSYRAIARANSAFFGGLYKNFPDYMEETK